MQDSSRTVFAVVLAAGRSSRFGTTKQAAEIAGVAMVQRTLQVAARVCGDRVITVIGHDAATVLRCTRSSHGFLVVNEDYDAGLGSSIAAAAWACPSNADALLLLLADQVLVTADHLSTLLRNWSGHANEIVATAFAHTEGPPVLMPRATFGALRALSGDAGARALFQDDRFQLTTVRFDDAAIDIDTPSDLAALT